MKEKHTELSLLVEQVILGESEQIDELKKDTLKKYISKSQDDVYVASHEKMPETDIEGEAKWLDKYDKKISNRNKGLDIAHKKLKKGDFQESLIDQLSDAIEYLDEDQIQLVAEMVVELMETSYDRELDPKKPIIIHGVKGMKSTPFKKKFKNMDAYDKWADTDEYGNHEVHSVQNQDQYNEEVEELDELKKETLGNYIKKASQNSRYHEYWKGVEDRGANKIGKSFSKKGLQRQKGVDQATDKLVKGQYQEEYIEEELSELISGVILDEAVKVSKSSEEYYKFTHGKSPEQMSKSTGSGNFAFSTVPSKEHDVRKHDTHFVRANDYEEAKKKAIAHYKELGHNGEIHTLT